jgi:hypothetical protein
MKEKSPLRQHDIRTGAEQERERIIALLEAEVWDAPEIADPYVRHIIGLITGENTVKEINNLLGIIGK